MDISLWTYSIVTKRPTLTIIVIMPIPKTTASPIFFRVEVIRPCSNGIGKIRSVSSYVSVWKIKILSKS